MDGKTAVITGSTQGLGETIAHLFADRGCANIVITGRNAERGAKVKAALEAKGAKFVFVQSDLSKIEDVRKIMAARTSSAPVADPRARSPSSPRTSPTA